MPEGKPETAERLDLADVIVLAILFVPMGAVVLMILSVYGLVHL